MYPGVRIDRDYFHGGFVRDYSDPIIAECMAFDSMRMAEMFELEGARVGILGCAFGYSVYALRQLGARAFGLDISDYAIGRAEPEVAPYLMVGDATDPGVMHAFEDLAGARFDLLVTENMLPLLTDDEAREAVRLFRRHADLVVHRMSMTYESVVPRPRYITERAGAAHNWHSPSEWRGLIGPRDRLFDFEDWDREYPPKARLQRVAA